MFSANHLSFRAPEILNRYAVFSRFRRTVAADLGRPWTSMVSSASHDSGGG